MDSAVMSRSEIIRSDADVHSPLGLMGFGSLPGRLVIAHRRRASVYSDMSGTTS